MGYPHAMSLAEIKTAIGALSERERCELNAWLQNWPADEWDRQMEADAAAGKFDTMVREAEEAYRKGAGLHNDLLPFVGIIEGTPPDASENLDHYLYGHPKK
jgi:hypothetical protein